MCGGNSLACGHGLSLTSAGLTAALIFLSALVRSILPPTLAPDCFCRFMVNVSLYEISIAAVMLSVEATFLL